MVVRAVQDGASTTTTYYVGGHYEVQVVGGNQTITKYYYANGKRVAFYRPGGPGTSPYYYIHSDNLGSANKITDNTGAVKNSYLYYPWGSTRERSEQIAYDYRYNGQRAVDSVGMYYYSDGKSYGRFYDPVIARWTQADSIVPKPGDPQAHNQYSYTGNNPLKYIDPTGHYVLFVGGMFTGNDYQQNRDSWSVMMNGLGLNPNDQTAGEGWGFFNWGGEPGASDIVPMEAAADRLAEQIEGKTDIKLIGHSRGGALVMEYGAEVAEGTLDANTEVKGIYSIDGALWEGNSLRDNPIADERYTGGIGPFFRKDRYANLRDRLRARGVDADVATFDNKADWPFTTHDPIPGVTGYETTKQAEGRRSQWSDAHGILQRDPVVATIIKIRQSIYRYR